MSLGILGRDPCVAGNVSVLAVCFLIKAYSEEFHVLANTFTQACVVFSYTCGEYDCIESVHKRSVRSYVFFDSVAKNINRELSSCVGWV